jgi:hypothetical protein
VYNPGRDCEGVCRDTWCIGGCVGNDSSCGVYSYVFGPESGSTELTRACMAAAERDQSCDELNVGSDCIKAGLVESLAMIPVYDCVKETACGEDIRPCLPALRTSDLAASVCEKVQDWCAAYECTSEWVTVMDANESWLSQDALDAAYACLNEQGCRNTRDCISAWNWTVFGGSPIWTSPFGT